MYLTLLQYRWLLVLNIYLLTPLLYSLGVTNNFEGINDPVVLWNVVCSILVVLFIQSLFKKQIYAHLVLFPIYIVVLIDIFLIFTFKFRLSAGVIWVLLANLNDATEFIETYINQIITIVLLFLLFYIMGLWKIRAIKFSANKKPSLIIFGLLVISYGGVFIKQYVFENKGLYSSAMSVMEHDYSTSFGYIAQSIVVYESLKNRDVSLSTRNNYQFNANKSNNTTKSEIYVLIIGESSRRDRWSLYGYNRDTTPHLKNMNNIIAFENVIAEWPLTQKSVPIILSRASATNFNPALAEKSVISAFKEVGFITYWFTTQPFDRFAGNVHILADDSNTVMFFTRKYDEYLVKPTEDAIKKNKVINNKIFIVLHSKGSHFKYSYRYPPKFRKYQDSGDITQKEEINNSYDNSILYTDYFISSVIETIKKENQISALMYVSDHGENLMDDERGLIGHNFSNEYDFPVPMILWYSDKYKKEYPEKIMNAYKNRRIKINTSNVFYSLLDMANINIDGFDKSMSIFSENLTEKPRYVYDQVNNNIFNYDQVYSDFNNKRHATK